MFSARAPHAETPTQVPDEQKVVPCTCLSSGGAPRGQARSGAPGNLRDRLAVTHHREGIFLFTLFHLRAQPARSRSLASLRCLCVLIRLQSPRRFPDSRLRLLSSLFFFFLGALTFVARRAARISWLGCFFFMYAKLLSCATLKKKKNHYPHPMARAFETDRHSHQTVDLQQLSARLIVLH